MNNLHIHLSNLKNDSRLFKITDSLIKKKTEARGGIFNKIYIAGLYGKGLLIEEQISEQRQINRFILKSKYFGNLFFIQVLKYFEFCFRIYIFYRKKNIRVINVHCLQLLPLGIVLKYIFKSKLIYDIHELETEAYNYRGIKKKIFKVIETVGIVYVDLVIVVSESIADWYVFEYKISRPTVVLNVPFRRSLEYHNYFREKLSIREDQKILLYQGGFMLERGISLILESFKLRNDDRIVAVFMGYGPLETDIIKASKMCKNIYLYPAVPPDILLEYTSSADIGIVLTENTCISHFYSMPNKLFEYAMAGLAVLVSNMKDMSALVQKNAMGLVIDQFTPQAINRAIDDLIDSDLVLMRNNAHRIAYINAWEAQELTMLNAYKYLNI